MLIKIPYSYVVPGTLFYVPRMYDNVVVVHHLAFRLIYDTYQATAVKKKPQNSRNLSLRFPGK